MKTFTSELYATKKKTHEKANKELIRARKLIKNKIMKM